MAANAMYVIEDAIHAEPQGEFSTRDQAIEELERRAAIPWNEAPNIAPCRSWQTCGRHYDLVEYDIAATPWKETKRERILEVSAAEVMWQPHGSELGS
jgi:hypothetical protein